VHKRGGGGREVRRRRRARLHGEVVGEVGVLAGEPAPRLQDHHARALCLRARRRHVSMAALGVFIKILIVPPRDAACSCITPMRQPAAHAAPCVVQRVTQEQRTGACATAQRARPGCPKLASPGPTRQQDSRRGLGAALHAGLWPCATALPGCYVLQRPDCVSSAIGCVWHVNRRVGLSARAHAPE